jgi:acetylornithine/succinyldiaminopimelate/putrescine aminotransferase
MIGVDIDGDAWPVLEAGAAAASAAKEPGGLLMLSAGPQTLRLLPPYTVSDGEIELALAMLKKLLDR